MKQKKVISFSKAVLLLILTVIILPQCIFGKERIPLLTAREGEQQIEMLLRKLAVKVMIDGPIAETTMTMTFFNPHQRQLAGDLYFALPEGAFVSGYALDVNGVMVDGVVVEKEKGRVVFEKLVRQKIDPGIVEQVKGNNFKTRIFPLPPRGERIVKVKYISELAFNKEGTFYQLPLNYGVKVEDFTLTVKVVRGEAQPEVRAGSFANLHFDRWQENYKAELHERDYLLKKDLLLEIPQTDSDTVRVGKNSFDEYHFLIDVSVSHNLPSALSTIPEKRIALIWDASGSRAGLNYERELATLDYFFKKHRQQALEVELFFLRNDLEEAGLFSINGGNWDSLREKLQQAAYDGGTQLGALELPAKKGKFSFCLFFSDGLSNFGKEEPPIMNFPFYIFSESSTANHLLLADLAERSGGSYFNLNKITAGEAASLIGVKRLQLVNIKTDPRQLEELYPRAPFAVGKRLLLTGKLLAAEAEIVLEFGFAGKVEESKAYRLKRSKAISGELISTFWAQKKIAALSIAARQNEHELTETGKRYGLVTPKTSLIVLDNLQQYLEYNIEPPASLPEMRRQYREIKNRQAIERKEFERNKLDRIRQLWQQRLAWWKTDFSNIKPVQNFKADKISLTQAQSPRFNLSELLPPALTPGIAGMVVLEDGSPIPGVTITLTGTANRTQTEVSSEEGIFVFPRLSPGEYELKFELEGFRTTIRRGIRVSANRNIEMIVPMETLAILEEVSVTDHSDDEDNPEADFAVEAGIEGDIEGRVIGGVMGRVEGGQQVNTRSAIPEETMKKIANRDKGGPTIELQLWDPDTPYLRAIKAVSREEAYAVYLKQRPNYISSPAFF